MASRIQTLEVPARPVLPTPEQSYSNRTASESNRVLHNFFTKLVSSLSSLFAPNGGQYIESPYGLFFSTTTQTVAAINTAYAIDFEIPYLENGIEVNSGTNSRVYVSIGGIYNFQFSGQLRSASASAKHVHIWIVRNGIAINYSAKMYTISGSNEHKNVDWNFSIDMQAGDYLEMRWSSSSTDVSLEAAAAGTPYPGMPSAVMSVTFVSPLPQVLPTVP